MKQPTVTTKSKIGTEENLLSIKIDGDWTANDFSDLFNSVLILYEFHKVLNSKEKLNTHYFQNNIVSVNGDLYCKTGFQQPTEDKEKTPEEELIEAIFGEISEPFKTEEYISDLRILQIQYASPGRSDFLGLGMIFKEVMITIRHYLPNKAEKTKRAILEQKLLKSKILNLKAMGYTAKEIKLMIQAQEHAVKTLSELDSKGKILSAEMEEMNT